MYTIYIQCRYYYAAFIKYYMVVVYFIINSWININSHIMYLETCGFSKDIDTTL